VPIAPTPARSHTTQPALAKPDREPRMLAVVLGTALQRRSLRSAPVRTSKRFDCAHCSRGALFRSGHLEVQLAIRVTVCRLSNTLRPKPVCFSERPVDDTAAPGIR
jgi:hypothetical protein